MAKESEGGQSQVATAIDRAMSSNESEDVKQRMIGQALQQADIKGDAVVDVAEKIYAQESNIRAGGNASGKDNGDVAAPQTSSPQQGNGESKETTKSQVVATPTETVASSSPIQRTSVSTSEVESYAIGQEGVEIIEAAKESTTSSTKPESVIIDAEYEVVNERSESLVTGGSPTTPAVHSYTVGQEGVEIIEAPKESTSSSRQTKTETVIVDAEYEVIDDSSRSSSNFANEDVMPGTSYTPASSGHVVVGSADDSANKITNVDRTIEIEYEQQETNTSNTEHRESETYENTEHSIEQTSEVSDTPHRKKELARQQRLYKSAAERYQDLEEVEVERIEREMKVSRQDAQRIAINLGKRAPKPKDQ